jgi:hypothetical protein
MGYILKNTSGLINTRITDTGRQKISQGNFNISYFQIGDSEVSYNAIPQTQYNQYNNWILEPSFNAQNSAGVPQSNKENIKYPYYVDGNAGNTYGIPFMQSIVSPVYNTASPRGFFLGTTTKQGTSWSAITTGDYAINSNYVIKMNSLVGTNVIDVSAITCNNQAVRNYKVGDFITIIYDGNGVDNCLCFTASTTTTTTISPSTTTTTTNPCDPPILPTTTTTTTCPVTNCGPCLPSYSATCVVDTPSCYPILTYRITGVCLTQISLDRATPNYSYLTDECYARTIIYPSVMTEIYDSITPSQHFPYNVINFESVCYTDQFDVKIWNMNIPWSESPAGINSAVYKDYKSFGSIDYLGSKEYFGYASSSGQTDTDSTYYYNSFGEKIVVRPEHQKAIAIIHYTNNTIDFFYGEKFALEPHDITEPLDTTGEARNFKVHIPWIMWHKNPECCYGETFYVDPEGFDDLDFNLFEVHYLESTKNQDMNSPGIRYYHLWDTNPNPNSTPIPGIPNRVGKVFPDHKVIIIDDEELVAALSYKSNRNWTLPAPKVSLITPNICGLDNNSVTGILTGNSESLYVTYRLSNSTVFTNSLHSNYYSIIQGPNQDCNPINSQNVSVRFGNEFPCMTQNLNDIIVPSGCPCYYSGVTLWFLQEGNNYIGRNLTPTTQFLNGQPIFYSYTEGDGLYNLRYNGSNWVIVYEDLTELTITFDSIEPVGNFTLGVLSGFSECSNYSTIYLTICPSGNTCEVVDFAPVLLNGTTLSYSSFEGEEIQYIGNEWSLSAGGNEIAVLTGFTSTEVPIGIWETVDSSYTAVTSQDFSTVYPVSCECITLTTDVPSVGTTTVSLVDCYGVIYDGTNDYSLGINVCNFALSGVPIYEYITGDTLDAPVSCMDVCTTTTTIYDCLTTTTTLCPTTCNVTNGFFADKFEVICQKVVGNEKPEPSEWKIIDFTSQISGSSINGFITQSGLTGNTFVITQEDYDDAPIYNLNDYIDLTPAGYSGSQLNFGDEYYFYGNIETDIQATIYEMRYQIVLGQAEFQYSSNPTWDTTVQPFVTEIGLYDSDKNLMIISKLQSPYPRTGIQQFVIKLDI